MRLRDVRIRITSEHGYVILDAPLRAVLGWGDFQASETHHEICLPQGQGFWRVELIQRNSPPRPRGNSAGGPLAGGPGRAMSPPEG
jgi:hypothetical protein